VGLRDHLYLHRTQQSHKHRHRAIAFINNSEENQVYVLFVLVRISYSDWFVQLIIWNLIVFAIKVIVFYMEYALSGPIITVSDFILSWIDQFETL
jgi:hypothetical protein